MSLVRFYEPFIIVHDFAHTLDLEIDTSRKKQVQKGRSTNGTTPKPKKQWSKFLSKLHQGPSTQRLDSSLTTRQLQVVTANLDTRAYAFARDVVEALGDALFVAAPNYFRHESAVSSNESLGILSIRSDRSPFRLLVDGPTRGPPFCLEGS